MAKKSKWVVFDETPQPEGRKTKRWEVQGSRGPGDLIGVVIWSGTWRQYVFESFHATYNPACLRDIADFVEEQTRDYRAKKE